MILDGILFRFLDDIVGNNILKYLMSDFLSYSAQNNWKADFCQVLLL